MIQAWVHASELLTGAGVRLRDGRKIQDEDLGRLEDGAVIFSTQIRAKRKVPHQILWTGPTSEIPKRYLKVRRKNLRLKQSIMPGLVDCHTHLVFSGDRSEEFALRCGGVSYEAIARRGGGIVSTMRATQNASIEELLDLARDRLKESLSYGVRTIEIKSGYGLSVESELKILRVIKKLSREFPQIKIQSTFLGAHAFPPDRTRSEYMSDLIDRMLPQVAKEKLADACDVFIDKGYYTLKEGDQVLRAAKRLGLKVKVHADELVNTESATLAVQLGALSADHLLKISEDGIAKIARSNTVAVLLPGTAFYLKAAYAPARRLIDAGAIVALSTDYNPGTCVCLSLPTIMTISALYLGMTRAEIFAAVTYNGAKALGMESKKGTLEPGMDADLIALPFRRFEEMYYRFGWSP